MLSEKTALNFQDIVNKLKNAPLETYTTPAGALGGVLLTKLLKRRPELRHYIAGGALGAGAGYAGGRIGRHFLEGYRANQRKKDINESVEQLPAAEAAAEKEISTPAQMIAAAGEAAKQDVTSAADEALADIGNVGDLGEEPDMNPDIGDELPGVIPSKSPITEEMAAGSGVAAQQNRQRDIYNQLGQEDKRTWNQARQVDAQQALKGLTEKALAKKQQKAQEAAGGEVTGEADINIPGTTQQDVSREWERRAAAEKQQAAERAQAIRDRLNRAFGR